MGERLSTRNADRRLWLWLLFGATAGLVLLGLHILRIPLDPYEVVGIITGTICVLLAVKENIWNFPIGIVCNICFIVILFKARLYGIMGVQVFYLALGAHGWHCWARGVGERPLRITRIPRRDATVLTLMAIPALAILFLYLRHVGDAMPLPDALTTMLSLLAQYMLNLKRVESWSVGAVADVAYTTMYLVQGLYLTAGLYAFYFVICVSGYREWCRLLRDQVDAETGPASRDHADATLGI